MRYRILHGLWLNSGNKSLKSNSYYTPENEAEDKELFSMIEKKTVAPAPLGVAPEPKKEEQPKSNDLADVPGIGAAALEKLKELKITSQAELTHALGTMEAELKDLFGPNFSKVSKFLTN